MNSLLNCCTYIAQKGENEERDGGKAEKPAPAQSGHHKDRQQDLKHCTDCPKDLKKNNNKKT